MKNKSLLLLVIVLLLPAGRVIANAQTSQSNLIIINYIGAEMVFTLDETIYRVPGTDIAPGGGQLSLTLPAGAHAYSGNIPGGIGSNGDITLLAGQTSVLGARIEKVPVVLSPDGQVEQKPYDKLAFFPASLTPPATPTPLPTPMPLLPIPAGQGALVFDNYINDNLFIDINGTLYTVPPFGRRQFNLPPGEVFFSLNAGASGINERAIVQNGSYTGLGINRDAPRHVDYKLNKPVPVPVIPKMTISPVVFSDQPVVQPAASAQPVVPTTVPSSATTGATGLAVTNYTADTLTFTINNREYSVPPGGGLLPIALPPADYTFTASIPGAAQNGSLAVLSGVTRQLSAALTAGKQLLVYIQ